MDLLKIAARVAAVPNVGYVEHEKGKGYCVKSESNDDWSGGCYPSEGEANKRLEQVEAAKHAKGGHTSQEEQQAKSPSGWKGTVEHMKDHPEIDDPFALTNWMKEQGYKSHKKPRKKSK